MGVKFSDYCERLPAPEKKKLARRLKISLGYLYRIKGGFSTPSFQLAKEIERHTHGIVPLQEWNGKRAA